MALGMAVFEDLGVVGDAGGHPTTHTEIDTTKFFSQFLAEVAAILKRMNRQGAMRGQEAEERKKRSVARWNLYCFFWLCFS